MFRTIRIMSSIFRIHLKHLFSRELVYITSIIQPFVYVLMTFLVFQYKGQGNVITHIIFGSAFTGLWGLVVFGSASNIENERAMGTLELNFASPFPFPLILLSKIITNTLIGSISFVLSYFYAAILLQKPIIIPRPRILVIGLILSILSIVSISLLLTYLFSISRRSRILLNFFEFPIFLLCGFFVPVSVLPVFIRPLSYVFAPTWALEVLRGSFNQAFFSIQTSITMGSLLIIIYLILAVWLANHFQTKIKKDGSIGLK